MIIDSISWYSNVQCIVSWVQTEVSIDRTDLKKLIPTNCAKNKHSCLYRKATQTYWIQILQTINSYKRTKLERIRHNLFLDMTQTTIYEFFCQVEVEVHERSKTSNFYRKRNNQLKVLTFPGLILNNWVLW